MGRKGVFISRAPRQEPINWAEIEASRQAARAQETAVAEQARQAAVQQRIEADPLAQLVRRCWEIERQAEADRERVELLEDRVAELLADRAVMA